jgi:D-alanyl-D-alanine carboxypeptidase/D-alanyl-D-alanine-endopeptidase (penicillin-binding protein 4)
MPRSISRASLFALLLAALAACAPAVRSAPTPSGPVAAGLDALFSDSAFQHAHWGVVVRSLESGRTLYERNAEKLFMPASNMKLVTGAVALEVLGPDYRWRTDVGAAGRISGGVLHGDLVVRGSGDPSISGRFAPGGDVRNLFRTWADSLRAHGVQRISGAIVGVDTAFTTQPLGYGWSWSDLDYYYSAGVTALLLNEGNIRLRVYPAKQVGSPGIVVLEPATQYVRVVNETRTVAAGERASLDYALEPVGTGLVVRGQVPMDGALTDSAAVREPSRYFVSVLREALREAGIAVDGPAVVLGDRGEGEDPAAGRFLPLFTHHSPPLAEILPALEKPSQNQIAEAMLKTLGRAKGGSGTARAGAAVVDSALTAWGIETGNRLIVRDGSGLSRYNYIAPGLLADLLTHMAKSPNFDVWHAALPIAGVDGTLRSRMRGTALADNVHAKTGTIANTRSLSGYVTTASGERLVFSMLVNNSALAARDADRLTEAALARIIER